MVEPVAIGLVAGGVVLLLFGAALSIYGVALLGLVVGSGGGYLVGPTVGSFLNIDGTAALAAGIGIGAIAGLVVTYLILRMAIVAFSFVVGTYLGVVAIAPAMDEGTIVTILLGIGIGIAAGALGLFMKRTAMVLITSFVGAALASRSITESHLATASADFTVDPLLFDPAGLIFAGLLILGILTQLGLFKLGYVAKIVKLLPGASVLRDSEEPAAGDGEESGEPAEA